MIDATARTYAEVAAALRAAGCVYAEEEARLLIAAARDAAALDALVRERARGAPLEHLLGYASVAGVRVAVRAGVFVPRQRSEHLVRRALQIADASPRVPVVVDLGCGSGALLAAFAATSACGPTYAIDIDPTAVRCAAENLRALGTVVLEGEGLDALPAELAGQVDLVLANLPYVPTAAIALLPPEARDHEPRTALDGGPDGLDPLRHAIRDARRWLAPGGVYLAEVHESQAGAAAAAGREAGLTADSQTDPEDGTTVVAFRSEPISPGSGDAA